MNNKKIVRALKLYGFIGTALCACAGGIIGFLLAGPFVALMGVLIGCVSGHLLEISLLKSFI
jgi:hypothetical protein